MRYLARSGRVFGPYNDADFTAMKERGDLDRFSWLWSESKKAWEPLDPAPPPLAIEASAAPELPPARELPTPAATMSVPAPRHSPPPRPQPAVRKFNRHIEAIVHDFHHVISGVLDTVSETGCSLIAKECGDGPAFGKKSQLLLSLLDPTTGQSMNVQARFTSASREDGQWHYRLQWESCPQILTTAA